MGLHDNYYGRSAEPANNNEPVPFVSPAHVAMHAGIAEMRQRLGMPDPELFTDILAMRAEQLEHVASKPRVRPARNYTDRPVFKSLFSLHNLRNLYVQYTPQGRPPICPRFVNPDISRYGVTSAV